MLFNVIKRYTPSPYIVVRRSLIMQQSLQKGDCCVKDAGRKGGQITINKPQFNLQDMLDTETAGPKKHQFHVPLSADSARWPCVLLLPPVPSSRVIHTMPGTGICQSATLSLDSKGVRGTCAWLFIPYKICRNS